MPFLTKASLANNANIGPKTAPTHSVYTKSKSTPPLKRTTALSL